ncbi:ATP-dependent DNA helicase MER3 [Mactra antiquata]
MDFPISVNRYPKTTVLGSLDTEQEVTFRNINGDITLGSQYPVIHSINTSQLPAYKSWKTQYDEDSKLTDTYPSFTEHNDISYGARNTSGLSQMKYSMTDNRLKTTNNKLSEVNSMPDVTRNRLNVVKSRLKQGAMDGKRSDKAEIGVHPAITNSRTNPQECSSSASDIPADQLYTPSVVSVQPMYKYQDGVRLRSVAELCILSMQPSKIDSYLCEHARQAVDWVFPHFNIVQSKVFDDMIYTDKSVILCSPTGSGKTAVFEMAIKFCD